MHPDKHNLVYAVLVFNGASIANKSHEYTIIALSSFPDNGIRSHRVGCLLKVGGRLLLYNLGTCRRMCAGGKYRR